MTSVDQDIFPLPLTLVEKYFLLDTSEDYPMCVVGRIVLSGNLNRDHFEQAVAKSLKSHPLFLQKIEKKRGRLLWGRTSSPLNIVWSDTISDDFLSDIAPDHASEDYPLFIRVKKNDTVAVVHYHFHHARSDGTGLFQFFGDAFAAYATLQGQSVEGGTPTEQCKLRERDRFQVGETPEKLSFLRILWENVKGIAQWLSVRPVPLGQNRATPSMEKEPFGKTVFRITRETTDSLRQYAKQHSVKLNDLMLTLFYTAVAKWQRDLFGANDNEHIRVNVPMNMRWQGCDAVPATNIISYAFLTRKIKDCLPGPHHLLSNVHEEMQIIKDWNAGLIFLDALAFFNRIPGGLRRMVSSNKCLASMVLSNVGILERSLRHDFPASDDQKTRFGNVCLESMDAFVPCRKKTRLTIAMGTLAGQMFFCCNYERRFISDEQMQLLFRYYDEEQIELLRWREKVIRAPKSADCAEI